MVLTSRIEPQLTQSLTGNSLGVRSLSIQGLQVADIQQMLGTRGTFQGTDAEWKHLVDYYDGNPLILDIVATTIQRFFDSSITDFFNKNTLNGENIVEGFNQQLRALSLPAPTPFS